MGQAPSSIDLDEPDGIRMLAPLVLYFRGRPWLAGHTAEPAPCVVNRTGSSRWWSEWIVALTAARKNEQYWERGAGAGEHVPFSVDVAKAEILAARVSLVFLAKSYRRARDIALEDTYVQRERQRAARGHVGALAGHFDDAYAMAAATGQPSLVDVDASPNRVEVIADLSRLSADKFTGLIAMQEQYVDVMILNIDEVCTKFATRERRCAADDDSVVSAASTVSSVRSSAMSWSDDDPRRL